MTASLFFAVAAALCLGGALGTVTARNPIRGAVALLTTIVGIALLFLQLSAQFLAAIQLIVYAGAVVVLFVFVIMLLGPDARGGNLGDPKARWSRALGALGAAGLGVGALLLLGRGVAPSTRLGPVGPHHGTVEAVGGELFDKAVVPFELATALLIVAAIGAIAVARSKPARKAAPPKELGETRRLFVGPLHPRDTGRPIEHDLRTIPKEPVGGHGGHGGAP